MDFPLFEKEHSEAVKLIQKLASVRTEHRICSIVSGITKAMIAVGIVALLAIVLRVLQIMSPTCLLKFIETSIVVCLLLYSIIAFSVVLERKKFINVYKRYPYAVDVLRDIRKVEDEDIPDFISFHKIVYNRWLHKRYLSVCSMNEIDLKALNIKISLINDILRRSCSQNRTEITRYLICSCKNRANISATFLPVFRDRQTRNKILSIKEITENSFKSSFAYNCICDIVKNNLKYTTSEDDSRVIANENDIYVFFDSPKKNTWNMNCLLFIIPLMLCMLPCLYMGGKYRKCYVERIVISNINNAKIADAVIAKIDIIEQHIKDSIAFEKRTTIPLEYSAYYDSYYSAPYVGGIYSVGNVTYNGKDYGKNGGILMYTYGTDITITSYSKETDNIPARDMRSEVVNFSKEELRQPRQIKHILEITENRGRYRGYSAGLYFEYSFSVKGPELPGNESITNKMLDTYDSSNADINIKKMVNENFFNDILQYSAEDIVEEYISEYLCTSIYKIDIIKEVERMRNLVENREKYAR